jgi:hypothetical protein
VALRLQRGPAMKKTTTTRLAVRSQTVRMLGEEALGRVAGGFGEPVVNGMIIMKDTVIIRTGG